MTTEKWNASLDELKHLCNRFDTTSIQRCKSILSSLHERQLTLSKTLVKYHDILLFFCAYPPDEQLAQMAMMELTRLSLLLKESSSNQSSGLADHGLPFTRLTTSLSFELLQWIMTEYPGIMTLDSFGDGGNSFRSVLGHTLANTEKETITDDSISNKQLFQTLFGSSASLLPHVLHAFERLDLPLSLRDQLFESILLFVKLEPTAFSFSRSAGLSVESVFYHDELLKKFDHHKIIQSGLSRTVKLNSDQERALIHSIRISLIVLGRETEPSTHLDKNSLRYYELDRGISIAIYGMTPVRRQPLESYFGFTAFKNGFPMAYGGAWLFGERALFGMNIFEWFRGGESAFVFAQLIRVYHQAFGASCIEIEPYQYGKNNPEGIRSGAFWFYHRLGFRPVDEKLKTIAEEEAKKIKTNSGYRTTHRILREFTKSNIQLELSPSKNTIPLPASVRSRITEMIRVKFNGDRTLAEKICLKNFKSQTGSVNSSGTALRVMTDLALMIESSSSPRKFYSRKNTLAKMVDLKMKDEGSYQRLLISLLK